MRIAVVYHRDERGNAYGIYISELLSEYAQWLGYPVYSFHEFIENASNKLPENAIISIPVNLASYAGLRWFYGIKIDGLVTRTNADLLVCINSVCSMRLKKPQLLIVPGGNLLQNAKQKKYPWQKFSSKFFKTSINKSAAIITYANDIIDSVEKFNGKKLSHCSIVPFTSPEGFHELTWSERVLAKAQFTGNSEFFICIINGVNEEDYINVLKSFSKFKKWQQSSMQLLLIAENTFLAESLTEKLATYKYRDDVQLLQNITTKQVMDLMASAYALLHPQKTESDLLPVVQSMQSAIPVIAYENKTIHEYCGHAALYAKEVTYEAFGEQMIYLYKNENERTEMIECCKKQAELFKRENASGLLWKIIETTLQHY